MQDTDELKQLQANIEGETQRMVTVRDSAKEENRPVLKKNAESAMLKLGRINDWISQIFKDARRTW